MARKFSFAPGEYYHLYNRGFDKRQTFLDRRDHVRFLASLYFANSKQPFYPSDSLRQGLALTKENPLEIAVFLCPVVVKA